MAENDGKRGREAETPVAYIRKVGRGKTLSRDLGFEEARRAFESLLEGRFTPAQAGAFLQALRIKELSQDELDALLAALDAGTRLPPPLPPGGPGFPRGLTLNLASDTPRKGGYLSLLAAGYLAARESVPVGVLRSDPLLSDNRASWDGTAQALEAAAWPLPPSVEVYDLVPALRTLREIRRELGFRSCLHTAEKLLQPWPGRPLVLGISHRHYAERMAEAMRRRGMSGCIVLGNHGTPDLALHRETEIWQVEGDAVRVILRAPPEGLDPGIYALGSFNRWREEAARPDQGALGAALRYQVDFLRFAAGADEPGDGLTVRSGPPAA